MVYIYIYLIYVYIPHIHIHLVNTFLLYIYIYIKKTCLLFNTAKGPVSFVAKEDSRSGNRTEEKDKEGLS